MADQTKPMEDALQDLCDNLFDYMKQEKGVGKNGILPVLLADDEEELLGNLLSDEPAEPKSNLLSEATSFLLPPRAGCDAGARARAGGPREGAGPFCCKRISLST